MQLTLSTRENKRVLVIDWGFKGPPAWQYMYIFGPWCPVPELRHDQFFSVTLAKLHNDC